MEMSYGLITRYSGKSETEMWREIDEVLRRSLGNTYCSDGVRATQRVLRPGLGRDMDISLLPY
jgi:hypothetical protein